MLIHHWSITWMHSEHCFHCLKMQKWFHVNLNLDGNKQSITKRQMLLSQNWMQHNMIIYIK